MMLIPTGIIEIAKPWRPRPISRATKLPPIAATSDPTTIIVIEISIMRRFPNMSARRETIGVATALVRSVTVTSQEASSALTPRIFGKSGNNGMTIVCCSATTVPERQRIAVMSRLERRVVGDECNAKRRSFTRRW